jgi:hypothetical protein
MGVPPISKAMAQGFARNIALLQVGLRRVERHCSRWAAAFDQAEKNSLVKFFLHDCRGSFRQVYHLYPQVRDMQKQMGM